MDIACINGPHRHIHYVPLRYTVAKQKTVDDYVICNRLPFYLSHTAAGRHRERSCCASHPVNIAESQMVFRNMTTKRTHDGARQLRCALAPHPRKLCILRVPTGEPLHARSHAGRNASDARGDARRDVVVVDADGHVGGNRPTGGRWRAASCGTAVHVRHVRGVRSSGHTNNAARLEV